MTGVCGITREISARKDIERALVETAQKIPCVLDQLAFTDPLTGLPNRLVLDDRLRYAIATSRRQKQRFALMFLDLDHFKSINDTYGHLAGDAVLRSVAGRLQYVLRDSDTVARIGGDEFIIV